MFKIFVSGFPLDISELELVQLISPYATVSTIKIVRDKKTRKCKGYAFLEVANATEAGVAIKELNGTRMGNRVLTIRSAIEKPAGRPANKYR